jgi:aryl-alcohol dehydrogenase-like predicted oxidoreductase
MPILRGSVTAVWATSVPIALDRPPRIHDRARSLERRSFGESACVSVLGIGCGRVASISNPVPMRETEATLAAAIEAGVNLFDTADIYGQGDSERILGRLLRRHREHMFVVTKIGGRHGGYAGLIRVAKPLLRLAARWRPGLHRAAVKARTATVTHDFSPPDLRTAVQGSLSRLGLDRLDGLLLHSPSVETLCKPEIGDFLEELLHSGKAVRVGASVGSLAAIEAAMSIPALTMIEAPMEVVSTLPQTGIADGIRARKIGLFVREVLRWHAQMADDKPSPQQALSAAIAPDFVTAAIVGVSTREHLNELFCALR